MRTVRDHVSSGGLSGASAGSPAGRHSIRFVAGSVLAFLLIAFAVTGEAGACPLTNPSCAADGATKTVDSTVDKVQDTADDVTDTVDDTTTDTVDKVQDTTTDTVDKVQESTDKVTDTVDDTTDGLLNPTSPTKPTKPEVRDPNKPGGPNGPRERGKNGPRDRVKGRDRTREDRRGDRNVSGDLLEGLRDPRLATDFSREPAGEGLASSPVVASPREFDSFSQGPLDAVKKFAFPLLMTLVVGAFLLIQSRIDRRDPKLALAPLDHDMLAFE